MKYKRSTTRPMRAPEATEVSLERDRLQRIADAQSASLVELRRELVAKSLEAEHLFQQKVALVNELRIARIKIDFLEGRERNEGFHTAGPGSHFGFKRFLPGWKEA